MARGSDQRRGKRAFARELQRTLSKHPCGECFACCVTRPVDELGKPAGLPCTRLRTGAGGACSVHPKRPAACAGYECVWRLGGAGGLENRPDKLGIVFDLEDTHATGINLIVAREIRTGAIDESMALLTTMASKGHVLYLISRNADGSERCRMMGAEEQVARVKAAAKRKLPLVMQ